jgi:hypothetical protein
MSISSTPTPQSYQQILGAQLNTVRSRLGLRKFKPGGQFLTIFEASAQSDARISADVFKGLLSQDLDASEGIVLDRIGNSEGVPRRSKKASQGQITVTDPSFQKVSSTVYHGKPAPIVGSVSVYVSKGSTFDLAPPTGQVYLGRGTVNYEGPLSYSAKTDSGSCWTLTLSSTTKFHNQGESVILAQGGNRPIQIGQIVSTTQGASTAPVTFTTAQAAAVADGEVQIDLVPITCTVDGIAGNLAPNSIVSFGDSPPFTNATVTNPKAISFGRDVEQDNDYRDRIRQARADKQRGTATAIKGAVIDITTSDETSSVLSANVVKRKDKPTVLYIDDGNGYEEKSDGVGYETVVDQAAGGETDFLSIMSPIAQAYVEATNQAPYTILDGTTLTIRVGGVSSTHYFDSATFTSPLSASSFDVVSSVNANSSLLFQARLAQNTASVAFYAKSETNDDLQVILAPDPTMDAAVVLGLSTAPVYTTSLYRNDVLLSKDGLLAQVVSNPFSTWSPLFTSETLIVNTDATGNITVTINDTDFQNLGYPALSNADPKTWADVLSHKIPGVTATDEIDKVILTSNKGRSSLASVSIIGGTLVTKGVFAPSSSFGVSNDYSVDRSVGAIAINTSLIQDDLLSLGTQWSEAFIETDFGYNFIDLTSDASYYLIVDDNTSEIIPTSMFRAGLFTAQRFESSPLFTSFDICDGTAPGPILPDITVPGAADGDWVLLTDPAFDPTWKGVYRNSADNLIRIIKDADTATRIGHTSTALDGTASLFVLICGGLTTIQSGVGLPGAIKGRGVTGNCRLYDANLGAWIQLPDLITPRAYHTATLLPSGKVWITGGFDASGNPLASTETFDPTTRTFTAGPPLPISSVDLTPQPRVHHTATLLTNGQVVVVGGCKTTALGDSALNTSVQYEPITGTYLHDGTLHVARYGHQALLDVTQDLVIVFGGVSTIAAPATPITSVESYTDTVSTWFNRVPMTSGRAFFGAEKILGGANSKIVVAGGSLHLFSDNSVTTTAATGTYQTYTPATDSWTTESNINTNVPTITINFAQSDLVRTYTTNTVILGGLASQLLKYNNSTDAWDALSADPGISLYIVSREGFTASAPISGGPKGDNCAWFGGAIPNSTSEQSFQGIANVDFLDTVVNLRNHPYPVFASLALTNGRVTVVRSETPPDVITVPANGGTFYTADSFAPAINLIAQNEVAKVKDTTKVRLSTLSTDGSISIVDQDTTLPVFAPKKTVVSQRSQHAIVVSGSDISVPSGFQLRTVSSKTANSTGLPQSVILPDYGPELDLGHIPEPLNINGKVVGLKNIPFGGPPVISRSTDFGFGDAKGVTSLIGSFSSPGVFEETSTSTVSSLGSYLGLRSALPVTVGNPVYVAEPFKFSVSDFLDITVDGDSSTKRFSVPMARKMTTVGSYQSPLTLKDADNSNSTIATAFGTDYSFDDFAILSRARVISDPADVSKRALWRYYRYGEEGNYASVRYVWPTGPNQPISVSASSVQKPSDFSYYKGLPKATTDINIGSGALRKNRNISLNTRIGVGKGSVILTSNNIWTVTLQVGFTVVNASRLVLNGDTTLNITTLFGPGLPGPGLNPGDVLWFEGSSPASSTLQTGQFVIKTIAPAGPPGAWTITINSMMLNDGTIWPLTANPGTISTDPNQKAKFDDEVLVGDLISFNDPTGNLTSEVMAISVIDPNRQYIECNAVNFNPTPVSTLAYGTMPKLTDLQIFAPASNTITSVVAAVNANPNSPIQGTVTGTGAGIINTASWVSGSNADFRYNLSDGINYVANTNKPANPTIQTTFYLKLPVTGSLTTNNDFANETFYVIPQLASSVVKWLNTPPVTGLWSVASITTCADGSKVQIKSNTAGSAGSILVEGGTANLKTAAVIGQATESQFNSNLTSGLVITTTAAEAEGFCGNSWVELNNTERLPKLVDTSPNWSGNTITSISPGGLITFSAPPYYLSDLGSGSPVFFTVEKVGKYVTINLLKSFCDISLFHAPTDWIWLQDSIISGIFKILRVSQTESAYTYWIDYPEAIESTAGHSLVHTISGYSPIPGDTLSINSNVFGEANRGSWIVTNVGNGYTDNTLKVSVVDKPLVAFSGSVSTKVKDVSVVEKLPLTAIKKLLSVSPNSANTENADLLLDDASNIESWSQSAGTVLTSLSKLSFPNTIQVGNDAYRFNTGLIAESKRVIYGDSADVDNYPGYVSDGARVLIQGPTIKQIKLILQVRLQSNDITSADIVGSIKSAVAGVVNSSPVGFPIAISDIVSAAQAISGVIAVSVVSPAYSSVQDQIPVRGQEKAMVVDLDNDIKILIVGN